MHRRRGFTVIEVMLFFGISGFLIVGLIVGTSSTIARQRYNDSVQDLAEFFRREFAATINTENSRLDAVDGKICLNADGSSSVGGTSEDTEGAYRGRSGCLIYGRLIVIGEMVEDDDDTSIRSYDVIGRELSDYSQLTTVGLRDSLKLAGISVLVRSNPNDPSASACAFNPVGQYKYSPQWLSRAENIDNSDVKRASILIVRSPANGAVHTLILDRALQVQAAINTPCTSGVASALLSEEVIDEFAAADIDVCVGSDDIFALSGRRRNVRILRGGHNSSAVQIMEQDSEANLCQ